MPITSAAILAAGPGTRLDRFNNPKPLVKVGGRSLILWIIKHLEEVGVNDIAIVVGERREEIIRELTAHPDIAATVRFVDAPRGPDASLATSVAALHGQMADRFYLAMSDLVFERNPFTAFAEEGVQVAVEHDEARGARSGANSRLMLDASGRVVDAGPHLEAGPYQPGVYLMDGAFLAWLNGEGGTASLDEALVRYGANRPVTAVPLPAGEWHDVNTPALHIRAELLARELLGRSGRPVAAQTLARRLDIAHTFARTRNLQTHIVVEQGIIDRLENLPLVAGNQYRSTHFLLTDGTVNSLYAERAQRGLTAAGLDVHTLVVPPGETSKNIQTYARLADEIFARGLDKNSVIFSLGGGVVNNIAGFLASTLYRGIGLIHIPTTTMAQVDAAIDFKQAVNASFGKNLFGSYYDAKTIIIDPTVLQTLPQRNLYDGVAESIKHALTQDADFLRYLQEHAQRATDTDVLEEITRRTLALKVPLLNGDTADDYNEMLPQYGHSVAHAVEHLSGYELLHGEAVAIGMCVVAEVARLIGVCGDETVDLHYRVCEQYHLPTQVPAYISPQDVCAAIRYDKHHLWGNPHMALVTEVGRCLEENGRFGLPVDYDIVFKAVVQNQSK